MISHKSIRTDFVRTIAILFTVVIAILATMSIYFIYESTKQSLVKSMRETSDLVSEKITLQIDGFGMLAEAAGDYYTLNGSDNSQITVYLSKLCEMYGLESIDIVNEGDKRSVLTGQVYDEDSAVASVTGETGLLSNPLVTGEDVSFQYAYPCGQYIVAMTIPYSTFEEIIKSVQVGTTGSTYILDRTGAKVVHNDKSLVASRQNNLEEIKKDPKTYEAVAAVETEMVNGKSGFGFYTWKGDKKFGSYGPVAGTDGWSVNVTALESEFMSKLQISLICMVALGLAMLVLSIFVTWRKANKIVGPIQDTLEAIDRIYEGDLTVELAVVRRDEVGLMAERLNGMVDNYRILIGDISNVLEALAEKDLTVESQAQYPGAFHKIKESLVVITEGLNETIGQFAVASSQVRTGSEQVAAGAQALAQGSMEQASTIEELSATMEMVSKQIMLTAQDASTSDEKMNLVSQDLQECNGRMQEMVAAMGEISDTSGQIGLIIKTIEDIAFQTNILALNAAVEAARAGANGKGFAVVADEVRNLAGKSAEAAKSTTALIEKSITAVEKGSFIADDTASSLFKAVAVAEEVSVLVKRISVSASEQASAAGQINEGIDQVSAVVQTNSATAEESAASSEELLAQADGLQERVNGFLLK
ncbi:methyl-accepting chemotaxis protein [Aminipila butyrica]|uniref:Methyl-accepting chemotaxis protein n=1 Tax=Aminipila butyrica TaxID=433296 RepID=A0A858BS00_9FIRM|nr:methyl-accepting chemotaxis protein [Aminipila butyrica]QIB68112.1 methyl-accepting chemotaxis protein [Aminipila butyrica]